MKRKSTDKLSDQTQPNLKQKKIIFRPILETSTFLTNANTVAPLTPSTAELNPPKLTFKPQSIFNESTDATISRLKLKDDFKKVMIFKNEHAPKLPRGEAHIYDIGLYYVRVETMSDI